VKRFEGGDCFEEKLREGSKSSSSSSSSSSSHSSERSILACVLVGGLHSPSFLTSHHFLKNPPIWGESGQFSPSWSSSCSVFPHHCWTSLSVDTEPSYLHLLYTPIIHGMHSVRPASERRVLYRVISTSDKRDMEETKEWERVVLKWSDGKLYLFREHCSSGHVRSRLKYQNDKRVCSVYFKTQRSGLVGKCNTTEAMYAQYTHFRHCSKWIWSQASELLCIKQNCYAVKQFLTRFNEHLLLNWKHLSNEITVFTVQ